MTVISKYFVVLKMKYSFDICNRHKPEYIYHIKIKTLFKKKYKIIPK